MKVMVKGKDAPTSSDLSHHEKLGFMSTETDLPIVTFDCYLSRNDGNDKEFLSY